MLKESSVQSTVPHSPEPRSTRPSALIGPNVYNKKSRLGPQA